MKERNLLKIAIIGSLVGLFVLYFVSLQMDYDDYNDIVFNKNVGEDVKLIGKVMRVNNFDKIILIDLEHQGDITLLVFEEDELDVSNGDLIEVLGEVGEYEGKEQIIAQKIRKIEVD